MNLLLHRRRWIAGISLVATVAGLQTQTWAQFPFQQPEPPKGPWMDKSLSPDRRAELVLAQLTLDEKISMVHGAGFPGFGRAPSGPNAAVLARSNGGAGIVTGFARLGIPDLNLADSASGVTRGSMRSRYSTGLPSNISLAATWDPNMAQEYGALIGRELRDQGYNASLGGGVNITREARNGRNFEYQGEDPLLAGRMVGNMVRGMQAEHVIGDLKHYAVNDQETGRNEVNIKNIDKRVLRETDLLAFEIALKESNAGMVMASYNRVNGDFASENSYLLNDVLKKAWGFQGFVLSDWGATHSTTKAALAGLDMEQPGDQFFGEALKKAVQSGEVPMARLDDMVRRILRTEFACGVVDYPPVPKVVDVFGGLEIAQRVAEQGIVLLKNDQNALPLDAQRVRSIAVIGSHADVGVLSGGGSAQVDPPGGNAVPLTGPRRRGFFGGPVYYPSSPLRALRARVPAAQITYNAGTDPAAAAAIARNVDVAVVFVNQPMSEGQDAPSLSLPEKQDDLVAAVAAANHNTIVVLETGGAVSMPWIAQVRGVLAAWFPGIRGAEAITRILFGDVNPSAKLPVTFAKSDADLPHPALPGSTLKPEMRSFPGAPPDAPKFPVLPLFDMEYTEGLKVGYRWFDAENKEPLFAFGYGLSYTTFTYSDLKVEKDRVTFTVKNTGARDGAEIAQVYVSLPASASEPPKRLVAWEKVPLAAGASRTVTLMLEPERLSIFNATKDSWEVVPGEYRVSVGGSSRGPFLTGATNL